MWNVAIGETPAQKVARELRGRILAGEWSRGDRLPTVGQLASQYRVGRATVVRVLAVLSEEGLITTTRGWGTFRLLLLPLKIAGHKLPVVRRTALIRVSTRFRLSSGSRLIVRQQLGPSSRLTDFGEEIFL